MRIILCLLLTVLSVSAQTKRPAPRPAAKPTQPLNPDAFPLSSVAMEGLRNYSEEQVLQVAGVRVGQVVNKSDLEAAHARLMGSGGFDSVAYRYEPAKDGKGVVLTLTLVEVNAFYPLMFEEMPVPDAQILGWLKEKDPLFGPKVSATRESLDHFTKLIGEFLAPKGFTEPLVARLSSENPPDLVILIRPATPRAAVALVTAKNTGEVVAGVVQSTLYGVAVGTIFSEPRIRQLLDSSIRPLYEAKGRLRVSFPKITAEPDKDVKGVNVTVEVEQGPVYELGKVRYIGVPNEQDELRNISKIKTGGKANFDEIKAGERRLVDYFRRMGYIQARSENLRTIDDAKHIVDVTVRIIPGPEFLFRKLEIIGLDLISEPEVRKLWGLQPGKPFNPDYPDHFLARIKEDGLLDDLGATSSERKLNPDSHTVDVTLTFQGTKGDPEKAKRKKPGLP